MLTSPEPLEPPQPNLATAERSPPEHRPSLADVSALAKSLDPKDQVRLIGRLLESLSPRLVAAIVEFAQQNVKRARDKPAVQLAAQRIEAVGPTLWDKLFDPTKTSDLYSAPRRFDLATIFVVTAAYSILFGAMSALDYYFGTPTKVAVGLLVTLVAVAQAYFQNIANPRGVSVVAGSISLSFILTLMKMIQRSWIPEPLPVVIVFYGILGGAIAGYLSGVLVGGVFLVADALRKYMAGRAGHSHENPTETDSAKTDANTSPWTN